jgi:hypothetical protein
MWSADLPLQALATATFPKLVVSGGHSPGFDAVCDDLAERIGGTRAVISGAGHEIQFTGPPVNDTLMTLWRSVHDETVARTAALRGTSPPATTEVHHG